VIDETRCERTARLLVARLDALAHAAGQLRHAEAERLVELASVATMRAVALEMIQAERADEIWREAHVRHPQLPQVQIALPQRLAA
jgi:hypothetical protein